MGKERETGSEGKKFGRLDKEQPVGEKSAKLLHTHTHTGNTQEFNYPQ